MTTTNLIHKRNQLEKKKNRLKQMEAVLSIQERKKRTQHLIKLGGLVSKAQLDHWNANSLLGALLFVKEKEKDKSQMDDWTHKGGVAFSSEKASIPKSPVIVKFEEIPSDEVKRTLKSQGLKWNALRQEWEGYVIVEELQALLATCKVQIRDLRK